MPNCLIRQPAGLGDILYIQKICNHYFSLGYEVFLPIVDYYYDVVKKHLSVSNINICRENQDFPMKDLYNSTNIRPMKNNRTGDLYIPLQYANYGYKEDVILYSKYNMVNIDFSDWKDFFSIKRDIEKEERLYYDILKLEQGEEYIFVNNKFATPPDLHQREIILPKNKKIVEMNFINGYNVFDWLKVFEEAKEIHTVDTSICYLIEKLSTKNKKFLYSRNRPDRGFEYIRKIYTSDWEFIL